MNLKKITIGLLFAILIVGIAGIFLHFTGTKSDKDKEYKEAFTTNTRFYSVPLPETIDFAGEKVPLDLYFVREGLDRELLVNTYWHSNTMLTLKRAGRYFPMIEPILKKNGVPDDFKYLALIESGLMNVVSPANAAGFWQFLDKTGRQYGLEVTSEVDERYHFSKSTEAACKYLKDAYKTFGNWTQAAAAYNAGQSRISRESERQLVDNYYEMYLNAETARYIYRILAVKLIFEDPTAYGYFLRNKDLYPVVPVNSYKVDADITNLVNFAKEKNSTYRILKEFNPWLRTDQLKVPSGKTYVIELPDKSWLQQNKLIEGLDDPDAIFKLKDSSVSANPSDVRK